jgi:hypothetical protein
MFHIQAIDTNAFAAAPSSARSLSHRDDYLEEMQDAAELREIRAARNTPRRPRTHY